MIKIQEDDFSLDTVLHPFKRDENGAIITFIGIVRGKNEGYTTERLEIQAYKEMALQQLSTIRKEAYQQFQVNQISIIHRVGTLNVSESIVLIAVGAAHRDEAFKACRFVLEELKKRAPIWKKEYTTEGEYWVEGNYNE